MTITATKRDGYLDAILREVQRIQSSRTSLAGFVEYQLEKTPAKHHRIICQAVDDLLADEYDDLILLMPPNSAKSFYTSVAVPPYLLGKVPKSQILAISGTADLAMSWGRQARNNCSNPSIRTVFPALAVSGDSRAVDNFSTVAGGSYRTFGVNSQILGQRSSILLIDDPLTSAATSETMLRQLSDYYETEALTRLDPQNGKVILVCQRLARNDLAGYMMDRDALKKTRRLKVVTLKMECEPGDDDPLGRQPGERLWPERFTEMWVEDAKRDGHKWKTLYQQSPPSDTGQWCNPDWLQFVDRAPENLNNYLCTDLALSVGKGDYSVHLVAGIDEHGRIYIQHGWRAQVTINDVIDRHLSLATTFAPRESLIDDDNASKIYGIALADRARAAGVWLPWKSMPIRGQDKETRAAPLRALLQQGRVFLVRGEWNEWLVRELLGFPVMTGSGVDDAIDALSLIGRRLLQLGKPASETPPPKPTMKTWNQATLDELHEDRERQQGRGVQRI